MRTKFKQRVLELICGCEPEEVKIMADRESITLSRVMRALKTLNLSLVANDDDLGAEDFHFTVKDKHLELSFSICWKLLNDNNATATDDDQTDETIEALYNLIK